MIDFVIEFEKNTSPHGRYRKFGDVLIKFKIIEPNIFRVQSIISFNPNEFYSFTKMLFRVADKHKIVISGKAQPNLVGPSLTNSNTFYIGMSQERLLRLYQKFGFDVVENQAGYEVIRSPR